MSMSRHYSDVATHVTTLKLVSLFLQPCSDVATSNVNVVTLNVDVATLDVDVATLELLFQCCSFVLMSMSRHWFDVATLNFFVLLTSTDVVTLKLMS